ncbi:MAG: hypothetical protein ACKVH9_03580 [Rhodobacterales bacterium]
MQLDRNDKVSILSTAFEMADAGRPIALNYFRNNNQIVENKLAN